MSEYPALPIVTDENGTYAKGRNFCRAPEIINLSSTRDLNKAIATGGSSWIYESGVYKSVRDSNNLSGWKELYLPTTLPLSYTGYVTISFEYKVEGSTTPNIFMNIGKFNVRGLRVGELSNWRVDTSVFKSESLSDGWKRVTMTRELTGFNTNSASDTNPTHFRLQFKTAGNIEGVFKVRYPMMIMGSIVSSYRPAPEDLVSGGLPMSIVARGNTIDVYNSVSETIQGAVSQAEERLSTSITQTKNEIESTVSQGYYAKSDTDRLIAEASTILTQTYNAFEMTFNEFKQSVEYSETLTNSQFETITKFIRFIEGNIYLGQEGNDQMLKISSNRISFLQGNNEVAYISNSVLYIYDGVFINSLRIQKYAWVPRANGHLSLKKVS